MGDEHDHRRPFADCTMRSHIIVVLIAGIFVYLAISDTVAGFLVELVEANFFPLRRGWEKLNGTGDEGKA